MVVATCLSSFKLWHAKHVSKRENNWVGIASHWVETVSELLGKPVRNATRTLGLGEYLWGGSGDVTP